MLSGTARDLQRLRNARRMIDGYLDYEEQRHCGIADADDIEERNQLSELIETFRVIHQDEPDDYEGDDERRENGLLPPPGEGG